ncbi:hypothetical protein MMC28_004340 [Mycoblastus sanguinarius]|nr:hypothetical protein [Mycoblastus sanguinarius]
MGSIDTRSHKRKASDPLSPETDRPTKSPRAGDPPPAKKPRYSRRRRGCKLCISAPPEVKVPAGGVERSAEMNYPTPGLEDEEYANRRPYDFVIKASELDDDEESLEEFDTAQPANLDGTCVTIPTNPEKPQPPKHNSRGLIPSSFAKDKDIIPGSPNEIPSHTSYLLQRELCWGAARPIPMYQTPVQPVTGLTLPNTESNWWSARGRLFDARKRL